MQVPDVVIAHEHRGEDYLGLCVLVECILNDQSFVSWEFSVYIDGLIGDSLLLKHLLGLKEVE